MSNKVKVYGLSVKEISNIYGCSLPIIYKNIKKYEITLPKNRRKNE